MDLDTKKSIESIIVGDVLLIKQEHGRTLICKRETENTVDIYYNSYYFDTIDIIDGIYTYSDKLKSIIK